MTDYRTWLTEFLDEPDAGTETEPARRGPAITTVYLPGDEPKEGSNG